MDKSISRWQTPVLPWAYQLWYSSFLESLYQTNHPCWLSESCGTAVKTLCYTVNFHIYWLNYYLLVILANSCYEAILKRGMNPTISPMSMTRDFMASEQQSEPKQLPRWAFICPVRDRYSVKATGTAQQLLSATKALDLHDRARASLLSHLVQSGICNG